MGMGTFVLTTDACIICGETSNIEVDRESYYKWLDGTHIQNAFPFATVDMRELIKTGIHPKCWEELGSDD